MADPHEVTALLDTWTEGDEEKLNELIPAVYDDLVQIARARLRRERRNHTLKTEGLVHEAYVKIAELKHLKFNGRSHFYAIATQIMRRILIDYAKAKHAAKRGAGAERVDLDEAHLMSDETATLILDLEDALEQLRRLNPRWESVVSYRFFGGFTIEETALELNISQATANRDWNMARAWLNEAMSTAAAGNQ